MVVVDGGGGGIELMAQMAVLSTVAAVDGGGNDGVFITASHDNHQKWFYAPYYGV